MKLPSNEACRPWLMLPIALGLCGAGAESFAADWPQWRGPNRDGISHETGLLQEWPKEGPKLVWKRTDIGSGYSTPAVVGDRLFVLANEDLQNEFVLALGIRDGQQAWSTRLGAVGNPKQVPDFPGARSTPTVDGDWLYALSSDGDLACLERNSGKKRWQKSLRAEFSGKPGIWAYAESPLVDGDTLVCAPGGSQATLVGLNKATGEVLWQCALPKADDAAYASALVIEAGGVRQYVKVVQTGLVGVEAKTGKFLWNYAKPVSPFGAANIPTPVSDADIVYAAAAGAGGGAVKVVAKDGAVRAEQLYFNANLPTAIGGAVKVGDYVYGTTAEAMVCFAFVTGEVKWKERGLGAASLCYADGRLYLHGENGEVALVQPSPQSYVEKGRFTPPDQPRPKNDMEKAWAYPVVANGRLFIRVHGCLWCYDVSAK